MIRWTTWCLCALLIGACNRGGPQIVLPALDRSGKIQLLCADLDQPTSFSVDVRAVLPLEACELEDTEWAPGFTPNGLGAVTQTQTGEVSAINFTNRLVFDTNRSVPGFTAFRVGEQPTGIQISPLDPAMTYVSSFSPKTIQAFSTERILITDEDLSLPADQEVGLEAGPTDLAMYEFGFPADIVRNDEGLVTGVVPGRIIYRWLYAPIPDLGKVAQIRVDPSTGALELDTLTLLPLETLDCNATTPVPPPASDSADYHRICPETGPEERDIKPVETTTPCVDGPLTGPRPIAVSVDYGRAQTIDTLDDDVLLVADANQPVIHRFRLRGMGGATPFDDNEFPFIVTDTPTVALAITPFVPASFVFDNQSATQRYLYAISATDGSVLAIDYTEDPPGTSDDEKKFGAVLPVLAGISIRANEEGVESRNRVRSLFSNARAIEVVAPEYQLTTEEGNLVVPPEDLCQPLETNELAFAQNAANMRGVFLAVSLANGSIFFLDIYDLNATCRGGDRGSCNTTTEPDAFASIRRHRRRWAQTPSSFIEIQGTPALVFNASQGTLDDETGAASNSDGPGLEFITCPESMFSVFGVDPPGDTDGLICTSSQVWSNFSQRWDARWGGLIPASEGGLGLFSDISPMHGPPEEGNSWFLAGDVPFCQVGVLGAQTEGEPTELPGADEDVVTITDLQNTPYGGDRVLITGELPPETREDDFCKEKFGDVPDEIDDFPVWFPIFRAFDDDLEIGPSPDPGRYTLEEVESCYTQFTEYQIHTQDAYTVVGTESGFIHRTVADEMNDECILDDSRPITCIEGTGDDPCLLDVDTVLSGRAFPGVQFINPLVSFEIQPFAEVQPTDSTVAILTFNIFNGFGVLLLDTSIGLSSLPSSMLFSDAFDQLYFVDLQGGVRQIIFDPLSTLQTFQ
ncbi:MAG: hypothetical protein O7F08_12770 [Deltaproteobacteria bacterium]|nr:hypothetical protein [Deltaproteobacteria bacterium]